MTALVTPWPPQRNGIADYAAALARVWPGRLEVVTEAIDPVPVRDDHDFVDPGAFDGGPTIFHVGNNPDHAFLVPLFLRRPGVVVLHDLTLHYLAQQVDFLLPGFHAAQLRAERPVLAGMLQRVGAAGLARDMDHREVRLLSWLRAAPRVVVHSHAAARILDGALPGVPVTVVPHFCYLPGPGLATLEAWRDGVRDRVRARWFADLAFSSDPFVLVAFGFPAADKQLAAVLRGIARMPEALRGSVVLVVAGEVRPEDPDLLAQAAALGCADRVRVTGWLDEADTADLLLLADLVLALRFPSRGESSGAVARALGLGCAVAVSDHGAYAELPDEAVIKLPARPDPSERLRALFTDLSGDRSRIVRTRRAAFAYAHDAGDPARIAAIQAALL